MNLECITSNLEEQKIKNAKEIFEKHNIFKDVALNAKAIKPLNSVMLD